MRVELLHVPDCPNAALLEHRLRQAHADQLAELDVTHHIVEALETAVATGMTGSPTLLINGVDPFARPGLTPSMSCRLYLDENGRVDGAPSVDVLRKALLGDLSRVDAGGESCVGCGSPATRALRTARRRTAPADPTDRAVHHAILRTFAATGHPPDHTQLDQVTAPARAGQVLARLHDADVIRLNPEGQVRAAYPFSAGPTRHLVRLATGVEVYAMCAIDALGMPAMLDIDAAITTTDPTTDDPITVTIAGGQSTWNPATTVVFVGAQPGHGPSADICCDYLNMFTDRDTASTWTRAHPHITGEIIADTEAELLGRRIFGDLLARLDRQTRNRWADVLVRCAGSGDVAPDRGADCDGGQRHGVGGDQESALPCVE